MNQQDGYQPFGAIRSAARGKSTIYHKELWGSHSATDSDASLTRNVWDVLGPLWSVRIYVPPGVTICPDFRTDCVSEILFRLNLANHGDKADRNALIHLVSRVSTRDDLEFLESIANRNDHLPTNV